MEHERIFGTDGVRGRALEGWLSVERVSSLGRATGEVLARASNSNRPRTALLGHDGRRSGPVLEAALARGLSAAGYASTSAGLITTPGLATLGRRERFDLCCMVSASHNPAQDNGIKIFGPGAAKLEECVEVEIEARWRAAPEAVSAGPLPARDPSLEDHYLEYLLAAAKGLDLSGRLIVVDAANGGASRLAPRLLGRLGAQVLATHCEPDGDNINADCGATHTAGLQADVLRAGAQLGLALDGDGDRCMLVDERGALVDGDGILAICAAAAKAQGELEPPRIVATVMSNKGLTRALRNCGIGIVSVDVGDRRVVEALKRDGLRLGGEQSGHIVFGADNHYVGDGLYTALRVLRILQHTCKPLSGLAAAFRAFPQVLLNVPVLRKPNLGSIAALAELVRETEHELGEDGRVLLRYSGTEPLARVMVEGPDEAWIHERAQRMAGLIARELGRA